MKKILLAIIFLFTTTIQADDLENARKLMSENKYDEALKVLRKFETAHADDIKVHELIRKALARLEKEPEALAEYKSRYEKAPTPFNAFLYAELIESPAEREQLFRKVRDEYPKDLWSHFGLAGALLDLDRLQEGVFVAESGLSQVDKPARLYYIIARLHRRMNDYPKAAEFARKAYESEAVEENQDLMKSYEWLEISNTDDAASKLKLSQSYFTKYKDSIMKPESLEDLVDLTNLATVFVESGDNRETLEQLILTAQSGLDKEKVPESGEDQDLYFRVQGSLHALNAWCKAAAGQTAAATEYLEKARKSEPGPETFYFMALTEMKMGQKEAALKDAISAATYPPPYPGSEKLAGEWWHQIHGSKAGLADALQKQKAEFAPERKKRVFAQMISQDFQPFTMMDREGKKVTNEDLKGKITVLSFWAVWCPPCREELPHWNAFYAKHKQDPELVLAAVGDEPWETMLNHMKNQNADFAVYRNEDYWTQFDVSGIPTMVVIDPKGKIRFRNEGFEEGADYEQTLLWQIEAVRNQSKK